MAKPQPRQERHQQRLQPLADAGRLSVLTYGAPWDGWSASRLVTETRPFADDQVAFAPIEQDPSPPPEELGG